MKTCDQCGEGIHEVLDIAFPMPSDVAALSEQDRKKRAKISSDLCCLDGSRFFIRCVAKVRIRNWYETLNWGLWAEISPSLFRRYLELYRVDASREPPISGTVANDMPGYPTTRGHAVTIQLGTADTRPQLVLGESDNLLSVEQHEGIDHQRLHEILALHGLDGETSAPEELKLMTCCRTHPGEGWPFAEPPTIFTLTTHEVMQGAIILFARHDEAGDWIVLDRQHPTGDEMIGVCLSHVVEIEPELAQLADLPRGWAAQRLGPKQEWDRWKDDQ